LGVKKLILIIVMSLIRTKRIFKDLLRGATPVTKALIHSQYPDEYAYAMCAFELTNYSGETLDLLAFPVMPSQISDSQSNAIDIKKTASGVVVHYNPTFVPHDLSISGNFGRSFKLMVGRKDFQGSAFRVKPDFLDYSFNIKTGYGISKVLESIIDRAYETDDQGRSNLLFFHNAMRNANYIVEVTNKKFNLSQNKLDIVDYSITMKAVAPASALMDTSSPSSLRNRMTPDLIRRASNAGVGALTRIVKAEYKEELGKFRI